MTLKLISEPAFVHYYFLPLQKRFACNLLAFKETYREVFEIILVSEIRYVLSVGAEDLVPFQYFLLRF